ncbi:hypothetical protein [Methylobacterium oryzisoli]|uniref:hypothetical protein n=1 Tax=Methylobacterium oryzisoli TaxID=3385502 RepID=UPI003891FF50
MRRLVIDSCAGGAASMSSVGFNVVRFEKPENYFSHMDFGSFIFVITAWANNKSKGSIPRRAAAVFEPHVQYEATAERGLCARKRYFFDLSTALARTPHLGILRVKLSMQSEQVAVLDFRQGGVRPTEATSAGATRAEGLKERGR